MNAWMLAKMTKSSSPLDSSRQLFKFESTVSCVNCFEQGPSLLPCAQPQPFSKNACTLRNNSLSLSAIVFAF